MNNSSFQKFVLLLIFTVLTVGASLIYIELHNRNSIERSRFSQEIMIYFLDNKRFNTIANDIYDGKPILKANKGSWDESDIDDYLGYYEKLDDYVDAGSLNLRDEFDDFSDEILDAYHNKEIRNYIKATRDSARDNSYYEHFEKLAKSFDEMDKQLKNR
jgi:hypothetical protein